MMSSPVALLLLLGIVVSSASTVNLTLYRITPRNYTGITDLDTGDAAGDAFFGLYEKSAQLCAAMVGTRIAPSVAILRFCRFLASMCTLPPRSKPTRAWAFMPSANLL